MNNDNLKIALLKFKKQLENPNFSKTFNIEETSLIQTHLNGRLCPHCNSRHVVSNGNYRGRKKYKCKDCGKNFNDLTKTPFTGIHKLEKMQKYLSCMINGYSIRESARIVGLSISTSFAWRHKIMNKIKDLPNVKLKESIQMEEVKMKYSNKGQHKKISKEKRKSMRSLIFACDGMYKLQSEVLTNTKRSENKILTSLTDNQHRIFTCSSKPIFRDLKAQINNVLLVEPKIFNKSEITVLVDIWKDWMKRFHGVATDYLHNYLHWFDFLQNSYSKSNRVNTLINFVLHHSVNPT